VVICIIRGRFFDRVPEERVGWDPRGIVDREEQREYGTPVSQPRVMAAIHLDEHAFLRHAFAATAVRWPTTRSRRWAKLHPPYVVWAASTTRAFTGAARAWAGTRPRFPCARAAAPSFRYAAINRRIWRTETPIKTAASSPLNSPPSTWFRTINRCCSLLFNETVSFFIR